MGKTFGNATARMAAWFTAFAHAPAPLTRWVVISSLVAAWIWSGMTGWLADGKGLDDAAYLTIGAIGVQGEYLDPNQTQLEVARFAGLFAPIAGLLFAFSGQLGRSLSQLFTVFAGGHIVIAGTTPAAVALAQDCAEAGDVVMMVGEDFPADTAAILRKRGIMLVFGDPTHVEALANARAGNAAHVVALTGDEVVNLRIEAAAKTLIARRGGNLATAVHVALTTPGLLAEAREMRVEEAARPALTGKGKSKPATMNPKPFALDELAARDLLIRHAGSILDAASQAGHSQPHLVCFGFDTAAEIVVSRYLMTIWSARFGPPKITVVCRDGTDAESRFRARYPQALKHHGMEMDIGFLPFDWRLHGLDRDMLDKIAAKRGPITGAVVATGADSDNITLALAVRRALNTGATKFAAPVFMKEESLSEFSNVYASATGGRATDQPFLQTFGAFQETATRALVIEERLDAAAGVAAQTYDERLRQRGVAGDDLEALHKGWERVGETYRHANRASADSAIVKLWDAGWRAAQKSEKGVAAALPEELMPALAEAEHRRWCAERIMNGWSPGAPRDNARRIHPNLVPFEKLSKPDQQKDEDQVRAAVQIAAVVARHGFVRAV